MSEIESRFIKGTPTIPLKRFARAMLKKEGIQPPLLNAVVEFVEAAYWIENNIGNPERHNQLAARRADMWGLSEEEIVRASQVAEVTYLEYKHLAGISHDSPLTLDAIGAMEANKRERVRQINREKERIQRLRARLQRNFQALMSYSDTQLAVRNSNDRINFDLDPVYSTRGRNIRKRVGQRSISQTEYESLERELTVKKTQEDPFRRVEHILILEKSTDAKTIDKLLGLLRSEDELKRQAAAHVLDQIGWKAKTPPELALYYMAIEQWEEVLGLGEAAIPALTAVINNKDKSFCNKAVEALATLDWIPEDPIELGFLYAYRREWGNLLRLGSAALPALDQLIRKGDLFERISAVNILDDLDTPNSLKMLKKLIKDPNQSISERAHAALIRLSDSPFYLQSLLSNLGEYKIPLVKSILSVHPEWANRPLNRNEVKSFMKAASYLPPVGGKIPVIVRGFPHNILRPSMLAEEQVATIVMLRQRGELGKAFIHQLTVQGRLPDEFKYTAIALILNNPYLNDWSKPFFRAPWGTVAPMVHDGGNVKTGFNLLWSEVEGRTDFLQRIATVHQPNLEELEKLTLQEKVKQPIDTLAKARAEQEERDRLIVEAKAYQRLALTLHSKIDTAPEVIPATTRASLALHWEIFVDKMKMLLKEYQLSGVAEVTWFTPTPRQVEGWENYGLRQEAEWSPVQKELTILEEVREQHPELRNRISHILQEATNAIDREIGLLPSA